LLRAGAILLLLAGPVASAAAQATKATAEQAAFFESKIRPLLVDVCVDCHGAKKQKGDLRLDSKAGWMQGGASGQVILPGNPDDSLLLLKSTGQVEHAGGTRFSKGSWQYQMFRQWIQAGAPWTAGSGAVKQITITPPELVAKKKGDVVNLKVVAHYADGSQSDITPLCDFRTNDDAVADVNNLGKVRAV